jgi:hypothetical protein
MDDRIGFAWRIGGLRRWPTSGLIRADGGYVHIYPRRRPFREGATNREEMHNHEVRENGSHLELAKLSLSSGMITAPPSHYKLAGFFLLELRHRGESGSIAGLTVSPIERLSVGQIHLWVADSRDDRRKV